MLKVEFYSFIFARTLEYAFDSPFIINRESRIQWTQIYLPFPVHIIIESRCPFHPDTRGETYISILEFVHKLRRRHRIITGYHKTWRFYGSSLMGRETDTDIQSIDNLDCMAEIEIQVLEIIKMNQVEIEYTVRHGFQFIQHLTAINSVTIPHIQADKSPFLRPILKICVQWPIKLLACEIISEFRNNTEQFISPKKTVITKILPIWQAIASTITEQ